MFLLNARKITGAGSLLKIRAGDLKKREREERDRQRQREISGTRDMVIKIPSNVNPNKSERTLSSTSLKLFGKLQSFYSSIR